MSKLVVIMEHDNGYINCVAICDYANEAYGAAYIALTCDLDRGSYYVSLADCTEGEHGEVIQVVDKKTQKVLRWATVLFFYEPEKDGAKSEAGHE